MLLLKSSDDLRQDGKKQMQECRENYVFLWKKQYTTEADKEV